MGCDKHLSHWTEGCHDCQIAKMGCTWADTTHLWIPESDYCQRRYCAEYKPGRVRLLEAIA